MQNDKFYKAIQLTESGNTLRASYQTLKTTMNSVFTAHYKNPDMVGAQQPMNGLQALPPQFDPMTPFQQPHMVFGPNPSGFESYVKIDHQINKEALDEINDAIKEASSKIIGILNKYSKGN